MPQKLRRPTALQVQVLRLVASEKNGREIAQLYEERTGSEIPYGTLYSLLRRMKERGLIGVRDGSRRTGDARLRYFKLTPKGKSVLNKAQAYYEGFGKALTVPWSG